MKLTGTIIDITKKHDGTIWTNLLNPFADNVCFGGREMDGYYVLERALGYVRQRNGMDLDNARRAMKRIAYECLFNIENNKANAYRYGETWNFGSVITDNNMKESVLNYIDQINVSPDTKTKINEIEAKVFENNAPAKERKKRTVAVQSNSESEEKVERNYDVDGLKIAINNLMKFCSEFDFEPNFRFLNTLSRVGSNNKAAAIKYIVNYFKLIDSPYINDISEKMKSPEFDSILDVICNENNTTLKKINKRFELYYGSQGTGKTTEAMKLANGKAIVCHSAMLPSDLMEDFAFDDGKANFHPSALCKAMENGEAIVLDEINLLPFESLRFLQGILDGKQSFIFKGHEIKIADGFKIIGTMNLSVNGMTYALPSPIVDRCEVIKEFKLTASQLIGSIV